MCKISIKLVHDFVKENIHKERKINLTQLAKRGNIFSKKTTGFSNQWLATKERESLDKESLEELKKENRRTILIMLATLALAVVKLVVDLAKVIKS